MDRSRREVLGVVASGLLAGCAGTNVPSMPNPLGSGDGGGRVTATPPGDGGPSTTSSGTPTATPAGAETGTATRRVFEEVEWFATEYGPATAEFRSLAARMRNLADGLSRRSSITPDDVATLHGVVGRIETVVEGRLGPHFDTSPSVVADSRELIDRVETLRERGDWDRVSTALADLHDLHATVATDSYVARTFPRDPVGGPAVRHVTRTGHAGDAAVVAYHVGADAVVRIRQNPGGNPRTAPGGRADVNRYRTLFGPLAPGPGGDALGDAGAYLTVTSLSYDGTTPLAVRRYRDAGAAGTAVEELLSGGVTGEGTTRFGGREWRRIFYQSGGDVVYADLTSAGPFLVVAGPSRQPWEDRPSGWLAPLELTWLWEGSGT